MHGMTTPVCGYCQRPVIGGGLYSGGQAYHPECTHGPSGPATYQAQQLTANIVLRDYFAAKAMALSHAEWMRYRDVDPDANKNGQIDYGVVAADAYELADAMLKARQR